MAETADKAVPEVQQAQEAQQARQEEQTKKAQLVQPVDPANQAQPGNSLAPINTGPAVSVPVENIEATLNELWRDVANQAQRQSGAGSVTMAQVLNLIAYAESEAEADEYRVVNEKITGRHPCRMISVIADPNGEDTSVQAWVSMFCQVPPAGGRQVCCEEVTLVAEGDSIRQLPAAVLPLLISDLPVFLWWPKGTPFDDYLFRQLADSLSRLIVDSAGFENPEGTLARLATRMKNNWPHIAATDMNWGRLTVWRDIIASFFDPPALRPYLERISRVTIAYTLSKRGEVNRAQALMAAGWLASRLGWQPADEVYRLARSNGDLPPTAHLTVRERMRPISIALVPDPRKSEVPGDLCLIRLEVPGEEDRQRDQEPEACFEVRLTDEGDESCSATVSISIQGLAPTVRSLQMEGLSQADLLDNELEMYSRDRVYEEAMDMVALYIKGGSATNRETEGPRKITTGEPISAGSYTPRTRPPGVPPR